MSFLDGSFAPRKSIGARVVTTAPMDIPGASDGSPRRQSVSLGGVPVYVMLPLDTVSREGELRAVEDLAPRLEALRDAGVEGVMIDAWWGIVERHGPGSYDWSPYVVLADLLESLDVKLHVVLSFHACGANRDDDYHVPLPKWVQEAVERDPGGLLFQDRSGSKSDEYLSLWADNAPMPVMAVDSNDGAGRAGTEHHPPRTPLECYKDLMVSFRAQFESRLRPGGVITEVLIGCGPCGELRYPAYAMSRGWQFPGVGEFQCYDRRALESLATAATAVGRPEWGRGGPHDAGTYNSRPDETGFFANGRGSLGGMEAFNAATGTGALFSSRSMMLPATLTPDSPVTIAENAKLFGDSEYVSGDRDGRGSSPGKNSGAQHHHLRFGVGRNGEPIRSGSERFRTKSLDDLVAAGDAPNGRWDSEYGRFFLGWYSSELAKHGERVMHAAMEAFAGCASRLALKCAGIHW